MNDGNSAYFHVKVKERKNYNNIGLLKDKDGYSCESPQQVVDSFLDYYQELLGTPAAVHRIDEDVISSGPCLHSSEQQKLISPISREEIKAALFSIDANKSPGPDGFSSGFYQKTWPLIQDEVCTAIGDFFNKDAPLGGLNSTLITLIPKKPTPESVKDYRPISCCNTFYKIISKILTTRMGEVMPQLIGKEQAAFTAGRSISDNTLLTHELVKGYDRTFVSPRCLIKLDIQKAFDSLSWDFIQVILPLFGFPPMFCHWIIKCITTTKFSLKINGASHGYFSGKKGLRQGDPLSPHIFILSMEFLSRMLRKLKEKQHFSYHPKCAKLGLTHLLFADDLMIFARGDLPSVRAITETLRDFSAMSGLTPNPTKTNIYFGGVCKAVQKEILDATKFKKGDFPFKYLGLPLHSSRLTKDLYASLIGKIKTKLQHWTTLTLTYAGKLQLLKSVIFGLENFWCSCFLLPKDVITTIEKCCKQMLWGYTSQHRKHVWYSWLNICRPKNEGGFGIKELLSWNKALMIKWLWKIYSQQQSIWVLWTNAYVLKDSNIWRTHCKVTASHSWKCILKVRDDITKTWGTDDQIHKAFNKWQENGSLKVARVYDDMRPRSTRKKWTKVVWGTEIQPKHSFILVLARQKALSTIDNLKSRGMILVNRCSLCEAEEETCQHLFFECTFAKSILARLLTWNLINRPVYSLASELKWHLKFSRGKSWRKRWRRCTLANVVYEIWCERNNRIFRGLTRTEDAIINRIKYRVCMKLFANVDEHQEKVMSDYLVN